MKLTWTYYPKGETQSVSLTVIYVPELDKRTLSSGGYLDDTQNIAYVNWETYRRFDSADLQSRQDAFRRLVVLSENDGIRLDEGTPNFPTAENG